MAKSRDEPVRPLGLDWEKAARSVREPYGMVDIGSNSVRLVVYEQLGRAPLPRFNEKSLCRLGDGLAQTGAIAAEGFRRTVEATRRFRAITDAMGVKRVDATATEAIRRATNGRALTQAIKAEAGFDVRILSGAEEARYATLGVISGFFRPVGLVGDMGGGSIEIAHALDDHVGEDWISLPLGALPVEAMLAAGVAEAKRRIDSILADSIPQALAKPTFYAVGGGWRALAKVQMLSVAAPVQVVHGYTLETPIARDFAKRLLRAAPDKLAAMPGVAERRARTLPAAAMMLDRILKRVQPDRVVFSALGLREGFIYSQLSQADRYLDPLVEGAQLIGLPLARVPEFPEALLPWTAQLFPGEPAAETRLRVAVCALSDMAWRDHPDLRAEESFRRTLQFPFVGLAHSERAFIATAMHARYAGGFEAPYLSPAVSLLAPSVRKRAQILGRAILLAYRISGGAPAVLEASRLRVEGAQLRLEVGRAARAPDSEVVGERLKLLARALGASQFEIVEREETIAAR
jgi:exopolyphosphatase / guanosine-5'-triphosphate,3'-diphosphate pyrophosphatase